MPPRKTASKRARPPAAKPKRRTTTKKSRRAGGTYGIDSLPRLAVAGATTMANQMRGG